MIDTIIEGVNSGQCTDLPLEELARLNASNEDPTQDNSQTEQNPDIVALLKDVYDGVGRSKLEAKYNLDLSSLLGGNIGNQSSWKGRTENAKVLIANYTASLLSTQTENHNSSLNQTLDDIVSLQEKVAKDFKAKEKRIAAYHERKHNDAEYVNTVSTSISNVIKETVQFKEKGGDWSVGKSELLTEKDIRNGLPLVPFGAIEPLDKAEQCSVGGNPNAIEKARKETPLLLYDPNAITLQLNLGKERAVRHAGMNLLVAGLALAATVVLSADILALGNACSNYIESRVPTSITYNYGWPESNPTAGFMTPSDNDSTRSVIVQKMPKEEARVPDIEYRTLAQLEEEAVGFGMDITGTGSANSYVAGQRAGDELSRRMAILDAAEVAREVAYNLGRRVRKTRARSPHIPTLVNVPGENGQDERIIVVAPDGLFSDHNPAEYAIARLSGFDELSVGVKDALMGAFEPSEVVSTSDPFYSQDTTGNLVTVRACNGRWESKVLSQRELAYHPPGQEILPCDSSI